MSIEHKFELKPLIRDTRDLKVGQLFNLPKVSDLPDDFTVSEPIAIKDQKGSDYCFGYAATSVSEDQEETLIDPFYQVFVAKVKVEKSPNTWGCDLRSTAKSLCDYGSLDAIFAKFDIDSPREDILNEANWEQWRMDRALTHRKQSYAFTEEYPKIDMFDSIRLTMWLFRNEKRSVLTGLPWSVEWLSAPGGIIEDVGTTISGHAFKIFGWTKINGGLYLKAQLSSGKEVGNKGIFYISRKVASMCALYGAITFIDVPKEKLKTYQEIGMKINDSIFSKIIQFIWNIRKILMSI